MRSIKAGCVMKPTTRIPPPQRGHTRGADDGRDREPALRRVHEARPRIRVMKVRTNTDTPEDAERALAFDLLRLDMRQDMIISAWRLSE